MYSIKWNDLVRHNNPDAGISDGEIPVYASRSSYYLLCME